MKLLIGTFALIWLIVIFLIGYSALVIAGKVDGLEEDLLEEYFREELEEID